MNSTLRTLVAAAASVIASQAAATTIPLLDEDFNDNAASYTAVLGGEAAPPYFIGAINIRPASNPINSNSDGAASFDNFFGASTSDNRFLVIGDIEAPDPGIIGDPNGQPNTDDPGYPGPPDPNWPAFAFAQAKFDLGSLGAGQHVLNIAFRWVVDTNFPGVNEDDFNVQLLDGSGNLLASLLSFADVPQNSAARRGDFAGMSSIGLNSPGNVFLAFSLYENNGTLSSAAGIDDIQVGLVVPEPGTLGLLSLGLAGLAASRRRKQ